MSKQSLQQLQQRLATRLEAVKKEGIEPGWLAVECSAHRLLLPLVQIGEIFAYPAIQPVPHTKDWFMGVAALRGELMGIVNLGLMLGIAQPATPALPATEDTKVVAMNSALNLNVALKIDRLLGLRNPDMFQGSHPPTQTMQGMVSQCLHDAQGQEWLELHVQKLSIWPDFLNVSTHEPRSLQG
jgi:twitching motility protein PilI